MCQCSGKPLFPSSEVSAGHPEGQRGGRALLCSPPGAELLQEGFPRQDVSVAIWCVPVLEGGKGQRRAAPGPGSPRPLPPLGAIPAAVAARGAELCFNSTWELNSLSTGPIAGSGLHPCPGTRLLALPWHSTSQTLLQGPGMTFQAQFLTFVSGPPFKLFKKKKFCIWRIKCLYIY